MSYEGSAGLEQAESAKSLELSTHARTHSLTWPMEGFSANAKMTSFKSALRPGCDWKSTPVESVMALAQRFILQPTLSFVMPRASTALHKLALPSELVSCSVIGASPRGRHWPLRRRQPVDKQAQARVDKASERKKGRTGGRERRTHLPARLHS
jgi:hypothetical protein